MSDPSEVRITNATGGQKGQKAARFALVPVGPLWELAEHWGKGAEKYAPDNWRRGYDWDLNYDAALRHLLTFWAGEDLDAETGSKHVIAAAWHCLVLAEFMTTHREMDTRQSTKPVEALVEDADMEARTLVRDLLKLAKGSSRSLTAEDLQVLVDAARFAGE